MSKIKKVKDTVMQKVDLKDYAQTLADIKSRIKEAQIKSALSVNKELLKIYWYIGETIFERQKNSKWGSGVIEQLAMDLQNSFPGMG